MNSKRDHYIILDADTISSTLNLSNSQNTVLYCTDWIQLSDLTPKIQVRTMLHIRVFT